MFKKIFLSSILALTLFGGAFAGYTRYRHRATTPTVVLHGNAAYVQVRASHLLMFMKDTTSVAYCSGTVIGPHALLTAAHCAEVGTFTQLTLDRSTAPYHLLATTYDGRDHVIVFVDGPAFTDIAPYRVRAPKVGEPAFVEGFGGVIYPAVEKRGKIETFYDPSEIDARQKLFYFSNLVIRGDSGAAVYGLDGDILGVVTWRLDETTGAGYELNFSPDIIRIATTFKGVK